MPEPDPRSLSVPRRREGGADGALVACALAAAIAFAGALGSGAWTARLASALALVTVAAAGWARAGSRHPSTRALSSLALAAALASDFAPASAAPFAVGGAWASAVAGALRLLGASQLAPALLAVIAWFPSTRASSPDGAWRRCASIAASLAGAAAALVGDRFVGRAPTMLALHAAAAIAATALLVTLGLAAARGDDALVRLRSRAALGLLPPALLLAAAAFARRLGGPIAPPLPALPTVIAGSSVALAVALRRVGPFGVAVRARRAIGYALLLAAFGALYLFAGALVLALARGRGDLQPLHVALLFLAMVVATPLGERLERRLAAGPLRPPVDVAAVLDAASRALAEALEAPRIESILRDTIEQALAPTRIAIALAPPPPVDDDPGAIRAALHGGAIVVGPRRSGEPYEAQARGLLETLAFQARAALANAAVVSAIRELNVRLEARVRERTAELDEAQARLAHAEKLASLGRLVAGVAHEINNPLNFVQANLSPLGEALDEIEAALRDWEETLRAGAPRLGLELADDAALDRSLRAARDGIAEMREGARRVRDVVASLRRIAGSGELPARAVDLRAAMERARALLAPRTPPGVTVSLDEGAAAAPVPAVRGSAAELERLFVNLIGNALDAVGERGTVRLGLRRDGRFVEATVDDDGPGVPPELRPRLFQPFFTTKPEGRGTGLGLSICDGIARRAGGTLDVADAPLGGARFRVRLPIAIDDGAAGPGQGT